MLWEKRRHGLDFELNKFKLNDVDRCLIQILLIMFDNFLFCFFVRGGRHVALALQFD